jgi:hypothetical protein
MNSVISRRLAEGGELLAVAQRLVDMEAADAVLAVEIGERAGDAQPDFLMEAGNMLTNCLPGGDPWRVRF